MPIYEAVNEILLGCVSPVLKDGKGGRVVGGGVNFVNPTGYDIVGLSAPPLSKPLSSRSFRAFGRARLACNWQYLRCLLADERVD